MSEYYKNDLFASLKRRIDKDYIFSMQKLSFEKNLGITNKDITQMDDILKLEKSVRHDALKAIFVGLNQRQGE